MQESLLEYYERELTFLRQLGQEFAQSYPKVAGRLLLEPGKCEDPHVERLLQAFALLAARIHHKIDDDFPEITDAFLGLLYPHYLAPIPSMSIVQFVLDPEQGKLTSGYQIPKGTQLYAKPIEGTQCRFRTCYSTTLWPIEVKSAKFESVDRPVGGSKFGAMLRVELQCQAGMTFADLEIDRLRFYLDGESQTVHSLYELLLNHVHEIRVGPPGVKGGKKPHVMTSDRLSPVGFGLEEGLLPYPPHAFLGYRLLQEYFAFPQKFLFIDFAGLHELDFSAMKDRMEVAFVLDRLPKAGQTVGPENFRLGCAPIVNLFELITEPIRLDETQHQYMVIPDIRRPKANEVYSIQSVLLTEVGSDYSRPVHPIYSLKHAAAGEEPSAYWYTTRRPSERKGDDGSEVFLSCVDLKFDPMVPAGDTLMITATCTNRDLPSRLPVDDLRGDFELEGAAPLLRIRSLVKPTDPLRPPLTGDKQWRLISHLTLNYVSLGQGGPEALQELLKLYDFSDSSAVRQQIEGIVQVSSRRVVKRPATMGWHGFCRGMEVTVQFDEEKYVGSGVFLFASVIEQFLGLYASLNSFTQLVAITLQRERPLKRWPPRAGEQILL